MASIGEVYEAQSRGMVDRSHLQLGFGLFLGGVGLAAVALLVATTGVADLFDLGLFEARLVAGIIGGIAMPLALLGILLLFPADRRAWGAAAIGAGITLLGVSMFWYAYPADWAGYGRDLTPVVSAVYGFGIVTIAWSLFTTVATFKRRNDPGGTVTLQVAPETGIPRLYRVARAGLAHASIGSGTFFASSSTSNTGDGSDTSDEEQVGVTDGGEGEVVIDKPSEPQSVDRYCGNCSQFTYGTDDRGKLSPYCTYHDEAMNDMEPCEAWEPNTH